MSAEVTQDETMKHEIPPQSQLLAAGSAGASPARWHLDRIVAELRVSREETHSIRRDGEARRAPSRDALETILNGLTEALFPRHYGQSDLDGENIDYFVGNCPESLIGYPGMTAIIHHRLAHLLHRLDARLVARLMAEIAHARTGIDIHPGATIGSGFFIDHGTGVVIGETAVIGDNVRIYQAVTLGARHFPTDDEGSVIKGDARHPTVEDDVVIYAGATILGRITIGHGSTIGGNVWLTKDVPPNSVVTQATARNTPAAP
jgi:serine O-acetyltransferase